jgi:glycerol-1-phosphate dehydrogenase [NAD(P)+]
MKLRDLCPLPLPSGLDLPEDVAIGEGARWDLGEMLARHLPEPRLWVADPDTWRAARPEADRRFLDATETELELLPPCPEADDDNVELVTARIRRLRAAGVVAVGSGTVNDVVKLAATRAGVPYVVAGTAASMNGFASGIAAILSRGLKTTVAARPPRAIVLDTGVLAAAPAALAQAGLGDLLSKPVSTTDWWLEDQLDGSGFSELPERIVEAAVTAAAAQAAGLRAREPRAHEALARALVLSGVAMVVAGKSSPASGGEHLMSHFWDMEAHAAGRATRLHGAQVGVATAITAALYRALLDFERAEVVEPPSWDEEAARIEREHGALSPAVLEPARRKHSRASARARALRERWSELRAALDARRVPRPAAIRAVLEEAGAPATLEALGVPREDARRALLLARDIRDRVTVLDLAFALGFLPGGADAVLDAAGV